MFTIRSIGNLSAAAYCAAAVLFVLSPGEAKAAAVTPIVSDSPLAVGGNVPGNLLLTPSVEFPTVDSVANLGAYAAATIYVGYFDSDKCYQYQYYATETATDKNHFYPTSTAASHACSGGQEWSGNYLNWAATQTIDPFRKALTGGYRVVDTTSSTILEKARSDNQSSATYFPNRRLNNTTLIDGATPAGWDNFRTRISRAGNKLIFSRPDSTGSETAAIPAVTVYQGQALSNASDITVYSLDVRVKVCVNGMLESNCIGYPSGSPTHYKPEGLIQKYSERIKYSAWGYLNDGSMTRDGGALRAKQKFVGPNILSFNTTEGWVRANNTAKEWDPDTGILIQNPDAADASATTAVVSAGSGTAPAIENSGVINYINKFGQMTSQNHKNYDPVSELYYAAIRYLKNQGNVPEYTNLTGTATNRYNHADGFPVITSWNDPIQYACQNNAILGIGDTRTHRDKNLPSASATSSTDEPTKPSTVSSDATVDVRVATGKVAALEGITINTGAADWAGRGLNNSAYIAGLAYDSHTKDMRTDLTGKQTVSTHWVDVREEQQLERSSLNQYWLAAKYGGFKVPKNFDPYAATTTSIANDLWQSGETLLHWNGSSNSTVTARPSNFYVASEAGKMIESLNRAFAKIVAESKGSASSLAANSTRLDTETRTFQAQFFSGIWGGELNAYSVDTNGQLSADPVWNASEDMLASFAEAAIDNRNIKAGNGNAASPALVDFKMATLSTTQKSALGANTTIQTDVVNYLRGYRSKEESHASGYLRVRDRILGDIVNSTPLFIGPPNARTHAGAGYEGGGSWVAFATAQANRTPVVYVGANDGMLHAFNAGSGANGGREIFAFVPNTVIVRSPNGLKDYASPDYEHKFYVDGETAAADIYDTGTNSWKTVLVGTLGRGGPGIFALDVTNPASPTLLWEKNGTNIPQLGKNIGRPVIAQTADGVWKVLLGNGPESTGGRAHLISIGLAGGAANNGVVTTYSPTTATGNGMTALLVRDSEDGDVFADTAYAGDLHGNVWKFTNLGGTINSTLLFQAVDPDGAAQPITAAPMVGRDQKTSQLWVFFGTGKYLNEDDLSDHQVQTWYGLKDTNSNIAGRSELVQRRITDEPTVLGMKARVIEPGNVAEMIGKSGWFIDLISPTSPPSAGEKGERMVVQNRFQGAALVGTSRTPEFTDPCTPGGTGFVMAIDPFTGARLVNTFFDLNGDGISNDSDKALIDSGDGVDLTVISGVGFDSSPNNPIFIEDVMQVGLDDGSTKVIKVFGSAVEAARTSWRELFNN